MDAIERALEILGLGPNATPQDIKQAYRDLVKVWHPDRFPNDSRVRRKAEEKLKEINTAYEIVQGYDPASTVRSRPGGGSSATPNPPQDHDRAQAPEQESSSPPFEPSSKKGKTLSEYIEFQKPILVLILVVGLARLLLSLAGAPDSTVKWLSISVVTLLGALYCAIRVHTSRFGSYKHLLPLLVIQNALAHTISAVAIAIAIFSGKDNIFSMPEYSGGGDGKTWLHVGAHLVLGIVVFSLLLWLVTSLILFITKKLTPVGTGRSSWPDPA